MHRFLALSLRIHLLLLVIILTLPTLGIIIYSGFAQREAALREAARQTMKLADTVASAQEDLVTGAEQLLSTLVLLSDVRNHNQAATSAILADLLAKNPHYANIFVADTSGTLWASAVPHAQVVSHAGYRYLRNVLKTGRFSSGEYATGKITGKKVLHFGYPLTDPAGNVTGVAAIALDLEYCLRLLAKAGLPERTTLTLLDHNGIVLNRSLNTQFIGSRDKETLFTGMKTGAREGTFKEVGLDGTSRLFAYSKVYLHGEQSPYLYIRTGIPDNAIVAQANAALRHNLLVLAPFPFIGLLIIWLVGKKVLIDRISTLQEAAQRLAAGDMNIRVSNLVTGGELGALGVAFDDMAENLARRESDLRESQQENAFLTGLLERSSQPFAIAYPDGRVGNCNPAFLNLVGYRSDELKTLDWAHRLTPPEWFDSEHARLAELDHADRPVRYEKEYLRKDGSRVPVELLTHVMRDGNGKPEFYYAFITDITERKRTEEELRTREEAFRLAFEGAKDAIFWADARSGILTNCNRAAEKMLGSSRQELIGRHQTSLHPPELWEVIATEFKRQVGDYEGDLESFVLAKSGRRIPVHITSSVTKVGDREIIQGIFRDISERVRMEQSLRESEELFRTLCNAAPIGIFREDCDGNNIYSNPRWEKITGLTAEQSLGCGWITAIHPDDREKVERIFCGGERGNSLIEDEHRLLTPEGKTVWARVLQSPIKVPDGTVMGYVGTTEDITEIKKARDEQLKTQKLESLGVLAGGIAHDFNNILMAILGNISLAQMHMNDPDAMSKRLEEAEHAAMRAKGLTRQLLTFARGGEPVKKIVPIRKLLEEAAGFATVGSQAAYEVTQERDLWVEADEGQLSQVFHNLVLNAVQAMPEGGTIRISADRAMSYPDRKPVVKIAVTDTGNGIPEHDLPRIFDPYFTTKQQGSGLGLATCYSIITRHGGTISVESREGQGSTFQVTIPALELIESTGQAVAVEAARGRGRILVMDDEAPVRQIAQAMLETLGYSGECVADGNEAVKLYRERREEGMPFAAVIMDLTIPGGCGGIEALAALLEIDPEVKAVVSSGYAEDPVMANYAEYGFCTVLSKPYRLQELSDVLKEVLCGTP